MDKTVTENKNIENNIKESIFSDQVMDYSQKRIIELDRSFSFHEFLEGAKEAFKLIVLSYKKNKLNDVKNLISNEVFEQFNSAAENNDKDQKKHKIKSVKASILNIEVIKKLAKIKVEFLSYQEEIKNDKLEKNQEIRDIWTFEKNMEEKSPIWTLTEVGTE